MRHRPRENFEAVAPVFVTFRVRKGVYNLRTGRAFDVMKRVLSAAKERFETRIIHFAVLGNHIHLIIESKNRRKLARAMKGFGVRTAKQMNRLMGRKGTVIDHRHHTAVLASSRGATNVLRYMRENHRKHFTKEDWRDGVVIDPFSSWAKVLELAEATTEILRDADPFG